MSANNQTFSLHRLAACMRKEIGENSRRYLLSAAVTAGLMLLVTVSYSAMHHHESMELYKGATEAFSGNDMSELKAFNPGTQISEAYHRYHAVIRSWLSVIFMFATSFFASTAFYSMASKEWRLRTLTTPASQFEKFLSALLISVVGGWLVCVAGWWLAEYLNYWLFSMLTPYGKIFRPDELGPLFNGYQSTFLSLLIFISLFLQSLFFLGSTVWPRLSFPKTFWAASLILVAMLFTLKAGFSIGFDILGRTGIPPLFLMDAHTYAYLLSGLTLMNYAIAYARLRETDVVRQW